MIKTIDKTRIQRTRGGHARPDSASIVQPNRLTDTTASASPVASADAVKFKIAGTEDDRLAASQLVYQQYSTIGLIPPNPYKVHIIPAHLSDSTTVIVGQSDAGVVCTVTLVGDDCHGLPMESIYAKEISGRRKSGLALAEVSCLAIDNVTRSGFLSTLIGMTRLMAQHARLRGIDQLVIAAHPKHARFYERFMGFTRFGSLRTYPKFRNHPAVASCLDFKTIDRDRPKCWDQYFRDPIPNHDLRSRSISDVERNLYAQLVELAQPESQTVPRINEKVPLDHATRSATSI